MGLDIPVPGIGTGRLYPHGQQTVRMPHEVQSFQHVVIEVILLQNQLVGGRDYHITMRTKVADTCRSPRYAGQRVPPDRFFQYSVLCHIRQLFSHQIRIMLVGHDKNMLGIDNLAKTVIGLLQ